MGDRERIQRFKTAPPSPFVVALRELIRGSRRDLPNGSRVYVFNRNPLRLIEGSGVVVDYSDDLSRGVGTKLYPVYRILLETGTHEWVARCDLTKLAKHHPGRP